MWRTAVSPTSSRPSCQRAEGNGRQLAARAIREKHDRSGGDANGLHGPRTVTLPPGMYEYMFVVDGKWITDPAADERRDDGFGRQNALLRI
jgi:hypothetical protein